LEFWDELSAEGYIDFPNIIYWSYELVRKWRDIQNALSCRYAWILVDEFQDTTRLQIELLRAIAEKSRTRFFFVGDPLQSIYAFAGADPAAGEEFAGEIGARLDFPLVENFRCSQKIVVHAERLIPRNPAMAAKGPTAGYGFEPEHHHVHATAAAITDYFIPLLQEHGVSYGEAAIIAPWWVKLLPLGRQLREFGIPIVGPGARPYSRRHLFGGLAEQVCSFIDYSHPKGLRGIEKELFTLLNSVNASSSYRVFTYAGRVTVFRLIKIAEVIRQESESGINWLKEAAFRFTNILHEDGLLPPKLLGALVESVRDMEREMISRSIDVANLSVSDLGMFASSDCNLKLLTMHRAKGREFDAVAIIDLIEGRVPNFRRQTDAEREEDKRLLYVGITRARKLLMYVTDQEDWRNKPSRFLGAGGLDLL
jgi:DNA helicase-2/ATP-dependent DNA helicase PcrA